MRKFSELGITASHRGFVGDKIKISKILNRQITVIDFKIENSKYGNDKKRLDMQVEISNEKHVVFTGSVILMDMIQKVPKSDFPFTTTILLENERLEFT